MKTTKRELENALLQCVLILEQEAEANEDPDSDWKPIIDNARNCLDRSELTRGPDDGKPARVDNIADKQCGCHLAPVDERVERCDLCSEATGMNDGTGWKIVYCPTHAAAYDLRDALKRLLDQHLRAGTDHEATTVAKAAIAKTIEA